MRDSEVKIRVSSEVKGVWQEYARQRGESLSGLLCKAMDGLVGGREIVPEKGTIPSPKKAGIKTSTEVEKLVKRGLVKKGVKELPSQDEGGFKTYFK